MNKKVILDASALLALLQNENGSAKVEKILSQSIISSVNYSEVISVLIHHGIEETEARNLTAEIVGEIIPFDAHQAYLTAALRKITKKIGLSFGDRACLALGQIYQSTVITADKVWQKLNLENVTIELIR